MCKQCATQIDEIKWLYYCGGDIHLNKFAGTKKWSKTPPRNCSKIESVWCESLYIITPTGSYICIPEIYKFIYKVTNCWLHCSRHWRWMILQPKRRKKKKKTGWFCHLIRIPENTHWMFWWQIPTIACVTLSKSVGLIIFSGKSTATLMCSGITSNSPYIAFFK